MTAVALTKGFQFASGRVCAQHCIEDLQKHSKLNHFPLSSQDLTQKHQLFDLCNDYSFSLKVSGLAGCG